MGGLGLATGQVSLPDPPADFLWESQGVMVYTVSDAFTVDLGQDGNTGTPGQTVLNETLSLTAFDDSVLPDQFMVVHSSTYTANLSGFGSAVVVNLGGSQALLSGDVSFTDWSIGSGPAESDSISNQGYALNAGGGGLFDDGAGKSTLSIEQVQAGTAPTDGGTVDFDFDGLYDVSLVGPNPPGLWFGTGNARGDVTISTVYERFELVAIPEPSTLLLTMVGLAVGLRRRRA